MRSAVLLAAVAPAAVMAGAIQSRVQSGEGAVANAVVHATPVDGTTLSRPSKTEAVMDQIDQDFKPHVLPVLRGTSVRFPNSDDTRHQVYSFSQTKTFELDLYHGETAQPVTFDQTGVATLGCNIHDWMLGYILVLDTPAFSRTDDAGDARIADLPAGRYRVELWHPRLKDAATPDARTVEVTATGTTRLAWDVSLSPAPERGQRGFGTGDGESLEEQFER